MTREIRKKVAGAILEQEAEFPEGQREATFDEVEAMGWDRGLQKGLEEGMQKGRQALLATARALLSDAAVEALSQIEELDLLQKALVQRLAEQQR